MREHRAPSSDARRVGLWSGVVVSVPAWIVGGDGWVGQKPGVVGVGIGLAVLAPLLAAAIPTFVPSLAHSADARRVARLYGTMVAIAFAIATVVVLFFLGFDAACEGARECPV